MKRPLCLICLAFVLALYCYMEWKPRPSYVLEAYDGRYVEVTGQVYQKEIKQEQIILYLNQVTLCDKTIQQKQEQHNIMCYCDMENEKIPLGAFVQLKGRIRQFRSATNPGEFDMREYYHILGIEVQMTEVYVEKQSAKYAKRREVLYQCRNYLGKIFDNNLDEKDAGMMRAMLLGERQQLDKDSKNLYQKAGIAHVLAISGLHISMLGMLLFTALRKLRIPLPVCILLSVLVMVQYGDMTGMSSSAYRAIIMFGMRILAKGCRRTYDMLTAMMISCMLVLLENPMYIYHSGFRLSFGAIVGIGLMNPIFCNRQLLSREALRHRYDAEWKGMLLYYFKKGKQSLQGSIAISSIHFPILLTQYYCFPIYSFFLNLLIIPLLTILLGLGIALLLLQGMLSALTIIPARLIHVILVFYDVLASLTVNKMMGSWITGCPTKLQVIVYFLILGILLLWHARIPMWLCHLQLLAAVLLLSLHFQFYTQITILDVGQGDGICMQTQEGHCYLIDGGSTSKKNVGNYQLLPFLKYQGVDKIEAVFLTHLDNDHISGILELMEQQRMEGIRIENVVIAEGIVKDELYENLLQTCKKNYVTVRRMKAGDVIQDGKLQFKCLFPTQGYVSDDRNAASLVLSVTCGDFQGLFTGDVGEEGEKIVAEALAEEGAGKYQLFKATHHGSRYSNTQELLEQLRPELTVISCGQHNSYGHPHIEALERFAQVGTAVLRTDEKGAIMLRITGDTCSVGTFISETKQK